MFNLFKKKTSPIAPVTTDDLDLIFPRVRNEGFAEQYANTIAEVEQEHGTTEGQFPVLCQLAGDLLIAYAINHPTHFVTVSQAQMEGFGLSLQAFHERAFHNFYSYVFTRITFKQMELTRPNTTDTAADNTPLFNYLEVGDDLEASCLLLTPLWDAVADKVVGELRISVPTQNYCLFCGADEPVLPMMLAFAHSLYEEAGNEGLSNAVFTIREGNVVEVV